MCNKTNECKCIFAQTASGSLSWNKVHYYALVMNFSHYDDDDDFLNVDLNHTSTEIHVPAIIV